MRLIDGSYIELNMTEKLAAHFAKPNNYAQFIVQEWEDLPYSEYIKPNSVILDIGANIGLFALHVMPYVRRIICVEPTLSHMNLQRELLNGRAEHELAALNNYTGKARFREEPVNTTMNTLREDGYEVDCITLVDLCNKYGLTKVDFCKIDIEGSEWQAVTTERLKEVKDIIESFFIELHPRTAESQRQMAARFQEAGYKVKPIDYNGSLYCFK